MSNRQESNTKDMISYITQKGMTLKVSNPHNLYSALSEWLILGLKSDYRRKEWAQDRSHLKKFKDIQRNVDGYLAAFVLNDWNFRFKNNE